MAITEKEKLYTSIINSFNNSNLPYAVIKNYELFPEVKADLDVIIDFKYFNQFVKNMINIAESNKYKFCIENGSSNLNGYKSIICLIFGYCKEKNEIFNSRIELFSGIYTAGIIILSASEILEKRILYKNIYIVSPEVEFLILVLAIQNSMKVFKKYYEYSKSEKYIKYFQKISNIYKDNKLNVDKLLKCKNLNANKLVKLLLEKRFDDFIKIINKRKFELFIKTILKTNFKEISIIYSIYLNKLLTFFSLNNGLFYQTKYDKIFAFKLKDTLIDNFIFRNVIVINKVNLNNIYSIFMILSMGGLVIKYGIIESKQNSFIKEYKKIFLKFQNRMKINSNKKITDKELRAYIIRSTKK